MDGDRRRLQDDERIAENKRIYELHQQGVSIAGLAERFGYTRFQISHAIRSYKRWMRRGS